MATRRYSLNAGETEFQVLEEAGSAVAAETIELTFDLAGTAITKERLILALKMLENHIMKGIWPPA